MLKRERRVRQGEREREERGVGEKNKVGEVREEILKEGKKGNMKE